MASRTPEAPDGPCVVSIVGTRPEAIKLAPVVTALAARDSVRQQVILTGQHDDLRPLIETPDDVPVVDLAVDPRHLSTGEMCEAIRLALYLPLLSARPALALVQGDTASALAGALAAADCGIPVAHVEAGLRSFDLDDPWPEEGNRIAIDEVSDLLFAPSETAAAALEIEAHVQGTVIVTGNTGIDAALAVAERAPRRTPAGDRQIILVTCHRRENRGERLAAITRAVVDLVDELPLSVVWPVHPNPHVAAPVRALVGDHPHIRLVDPIDYAGMIALVRQSWLVLTDSGGLQEEAPAFAKPVLVMRDRTERREPCRNIRLVGADPDAIKTAVRTLHRDPDAYARMAVLSFPFGDGNAAPRIAAAIDAWVVAPR